VIVCHCTGATDRQIRALVRDGDETPAEIVRACKAGFDCGGCRLAIEQIVLECRLESRHGETPVPRLAPAF
jgi:bacterioferritin-associated ferredoxin